MKTSLELIKLQTLVLSYGKSIINDNGEYKSLLDVLDIISDIYYSTNDDKKKKYIRKLVLGTPYKEINK